MQWSFITTSQFQSFGPWMNLLARLSWNACSLVPPLPPRDETGYTGRTRSVVVCIFGPPPPQHSPSTSPQCQAGIAGTFGTLLVRNAYGQEFSFQQLCLCWCLIPSAVRWELTPSMHFFLQDERESGGHRYQDSVSGHAQP